MKKNKQIPTLNFLDVIHECIMFKYINIKDIHMIIEMKTKVEINITFALKCNQNETLFFFTFLAQQFHLLSFSYYISAIFQDIIIIHLIQKNDK